VVENLTIDLEGMSATIPEPALQEMLAEAPSLPAIAKRSTRKKKEPEDTGFLCDRPASDGQFYPRIVPVCSYNYLLNSSSGWASVMQPFFGIYKTKMLTGKGDEWDWATIELRGLYAPMYDFCGGLLVSSLQATVRPLVWERDNTKNDVWSSGRAYTQWRQAWVRFYPFPGDPYSKLNDEGMYRLSYESSLYGWDVYGASLENNWAHVPDAAPFLGPDPLTHRELQEVANYSCYAGLLTASRTTRRRGIFGTDRRVAHVPGRTREIMTTGIAGPQVYFPYAVHIGLQRDVYTERKTKDQRYAPVTWYRPDLNPTLWRGGKGKGYADNFYRNPNSSNDVSVITVVPTTDSTDRRWEISKNHVTYKPKDIEFFTTKEFVQLLPNQLFHNG
jgi:hypothetical protein